MWEIWWSISSAIAVLISDTNHDHSLQNAANPSCNSSSASDLSGRRGRTPAAATKSFGAAIAPATQAQVALRAES